MNPIEGFYDFHLLYHLVSDLQEKFRKAQIHLIAKSISLKKKFFSAFSEYSQEDSSSSPFPWSFVFNVRNDI